MTRRSRCVAGEQSEVRAAGRSAASGARRRGGRPRRSFELELLSFAEPVADQVEAEHRNDDRDAGDDRQVGCRLEVARCIGQHRPPLGRRGILWPQPEPPEGSDIDDCRRERQRCLHDHGRDRVREDVGGQDRAPRDADRACRKHEVVVPLAEDRAAHQPREDRNLRDADRDHDLEEAGTEHRDDADREQQAGDREHDVGQAHDHVVDDPADIARDRAEHHADREADGDRDHTDQEREAGPVEDPRELVAPLLVDPEPVVGRRAGAAAPSEPREIADDRDPRARAAARRERR